jgi:hypothetical protein
MRKRTLACIAPSLQAGVHSHIGMWLERILIVWNTLSHGFDVGRAANRL